MPGHKGRVRQEVRRGRCYQKENQEARKKSGFKRLPGSIHKTSRPNLSSNQSFFYPSFHLPVFDPSSGKMQARVKGKDKTGETIHKTLVANK